MSKLDYNEIRLSIRELAERVIKPNAEQEDLEGKWPREGLNALAEVGWNSILVPKELDGLGLDHVAFSIAAEEIGKVSASTGLIYVMHVGAVQTILLYGNDDQKERWVKGARKGLVGTYSTSERASGGHWWFNFSEAKRHGEDYIVDAEKSFTTSSGKADYYLVQTRTPGAKGPKEISFFIVDSKSAGIHAGAWEALGVRGNHSGPIKYDNVLVPKEDLLAGENIGKDIIYNGVSPVYLIGLGSVWHGVGRAALEAATDHLKKTIHRDFERSLADYQVLRQQIAEVKVSLSSIPSWQKDLAQQLDRLQADGIQQGEILLDLTEFKIHTAETANFATRRALDVTGGYGYKRGPIERYFRDARAGIAMGPSNNIAREWIGKDLVGLPLEMFEAGGE